MIVACNAQLEVSVGEPEEIHIMSLYDLGGVTYAAFTTEDKTVGAWIPIPPPQCFTNNVETFEAFKKKLAESGYIYRNLCTVVQ